MTAAIENRISNTKKYLKILKRYEKYTKEEIENDIDIRGAVERYLYLSVQSAIDLAEAIISGRDFRKPTTMGESFHILAEEGLLPEKLTRNLVKMVGFRNIIAHDYEEIDYNIVYDVLHKGTKDIEEFLKTVSGGKRRKK